MLPVVGRGRRMRVSLLEWGLSSQEGGRFVDLGAFLI